MTGSAPISFNAGAESSDRASANTAWRFALRRRTRGRPIAPLAPAIRICIALPFQLALRRLASFSIFSPFFSRSRMSMETPAHRPTSSTSVLLERGGQVFLVGVDDEDREQLCRRGRACIPADAMDRARRLVPTFARAVDPLRSLIHL